MGAPATTTTTYLEMRAPGALHGRTSPDPAAAVVDLPRPTVSFYRYLQATVGEPYGWTGRRGWSDERVAAHLDDDAVRLGVLLVAGCPAGFYELHREGGDVQIRYLGLVPEFIGRGLGGFLLTETVRRAWALGARRVWLSTCTEDGPHALPNYVARGFEVYDVREEPLD